MKQDSPAMTNPFSFDTDAGDFEQAVIAASRRIPVLVDFWAEWCAPCRTLKPVLEKLAAEYGGRFVLAKVDSDRNQEIAARYGVRGIPNVKAFVDGAMVDEFTGAQSEAQVRAFIERLLPSPAEPMRVAAAEARAQGDLEVARSLLDDALALDPASDAARLDLAEIHLDGQQLDAARAILDVAVAKESARRSALLARLKLAAGGAGADPAALKDRIAADGDDLEARLQLANGLALRQDYREALEQLLEIVRRDRKWQDEAARRSMLDLFTLLGASTGHDDLVREFRVLLARTLN
jgi:putative thioredoxin